MATLLSIEESSHIDVYDLEIEGVHNFLVNGICVHNSSQSPNF
jgi:intein/homing endonuclease